MSSLVLLLVSLAILFAGYIFYGAWLCKQWGVEGDRPTPAHTMTDGKDYVPAPYPVLLGHHFASIAGAGPINGPIQAAIFGWLPVLLWILIGGIFFGAVQDFSSLFASIRHDGKSIGYVIEKNVGKKAKRLFLIFAYLTLLLVVAAFTAIVVDTFVGFTPTGALIPENGSTATISMLFILVSIIFGELVYRKNAPLGISTVVGVGAIILCIVIGLSFPIYMGRTFWLAIVLGYIFVASVAPVWILLQPRDYLNSFLLYGMMIAAIVGVCFANPTINLPAYTGYMGLDGKSPMFPMLFITVACGAISGFHSLVGSGTTAKQLDREKDAKLIGYGGMLIECGLAVIALICVGMLFTNGAIPKGTPTQIFATGVASMINVITPGLEMHSQIYAVIILSVSAFCLTSLDTATRLARYMFQEFFVDEGQDAKNLTGYKRILANPYIATAITVAIGGTMAVGGYKTIWPLFGASNQLLAALALLAVAAWLGNIGKNNKMFLFPMVFMLVATISSLVITGINNFKALGAGGSILAPAIQLTFVSLLVLLALNLSVEGVKTLAKSKSASK